MNRSLSMRLGGLGLALVLSSALVACSDDDDGASTDTTAADTSDETSATTEAARGELAGVVQVDAAECADGEASAGSYFRMVQSGGTVADGPFVDNADSTCGDVSFTPLAPGVDGGLVLGDYQPQPDEPFDAQGNGLAEGIFEPVPFFAVLFAGSTNPTDPQSEADVPAPNLAADAEGAVTGDVSAVTVAWNNQQFNQGAPKPDGSSPGNTAAVTGTYDAATGAIEIEWASQIVGGPFDGFTGVWHLAGTLEAP